MTNYIWILGNDFVISINDFLIFIYVDHLWISKHQLQILDIFTSIYNYFLISMNHLSILITIPKY